MQGIQRITSYKDRARENCINSWKPYLQMPVQLLALILSLFIPVLSCATNTENPSPIKAADSGKIIVKWPLQWGKPKNASKLCSILQVSSKSKMRCETISSSILNWGQNWDPITLNTLDVKNNVIELTLDDIKLNLSIYRNNGYEQVIQNDSLSACDKSTTFKLERISLCMSTGKHSGKCITSKWKPVADGLVAPSLHELGWNDDKLPKKLRIQFSEIDGKVISKDRPELVVNLTTSLLSEEILRNVSILKTISPVSSPAVSYDFSKNIYIYRSKKQCLDNDQKPYEKAIYSASELLLTKIYACSWAKIVSGSSNSSFCAEAVPVGEKLKFDFKPNHIDGRRNIVVIANSISLASKGRGSSIRSALLDWFELVEKNRDPVNLFTIESDGEIKEILNGEDLLYLEMVGKKITRAQLKQKIDKSIYFYANNYQPLKELGYIEKQLDTLGFANKKLKRVVYFADENIPAKIYNSDIGTALGWEKHGVDLHVVTNGNCKIWKKHVLKHCTQLGASPGKEEVLKILLGR